jgi:hypothetical protein
VSLHTQSALGGLDDEHADEGELPGAAAGGERDWDAEARAQGWKPLPADPANPQPHEFRGDPAKWTDSRTFVLRGEEHMPVLRETVRRLTEKNARQEKELERLRQAQEESTRKIDDLLALAKDARASGYKQARRELEQKQREAIQNGDVETYDQISAGLKDIDAEAARIDQIGKTAAAPAVTTPTAPPEPPPVDPAVTAFVDANGWFKTDAVLRQNMIAEHLTVIKKHPAMPEAQRLDLALAALKKRFPTEFGITSHPAPVPAHEQDMDEEDLTPAPRRQAPAVAAPRATPDGGTRTRNPFERIPAGQERDDAKREFERFKGHDPGLTAEEYVETYLNPHADIVAIQQKHRSKK